jgi:hypothetical protein
MVVLREVNNIQLNEGDGMAKGLFNLSNEDSGALSLWFDGDVKDSLMKLSEDEFIEESRIKFEIAEL